MLPSIPYQVHNVKLEEYEFDFRPFNVGMENNLLLIKDSKKPSEIFSAILNLEDECLIGKWKGRAKSLPSYIAELLFIELRKVSNGTEIPITLRCNKELEIKNENDEPILKSDGTTKTKPCGNEMNVILDLNQVQLIKTEGYKDTFVIEANPPIFVKLRQMQAGEYSRDFANIDTATGMYKHLDSITQGEQIFGLDDFTEEEFKNWCKDVPMSTKAEMSKFFFGAQPYISLKTKFKCENPECNHEQDVEFTSILDFFI